MKKYDPHVPHHMHIKDSLAPKKPMMWFLLLFDLYITTDLGSERIQQIGIKKLSRR
jgi:hypothetical protein